MTSFTMAIEDDGTNLAAHSRDISGCIASCATAEEVTFTLREENGDHLRILREIGQEVPVSHTCAAVIRILSSVTRFPSTLSIGLTRT